MNSPISKSYLLSWIKSLTLADHLGDVWDDVDVLLKYLGLTDRGVLYPFQQEHKKFGYSNLEDAFVDFRILKTFVQPFRLGHD